MTTHFLVPATDGYDDHWARRPVACGIHKSGRAYQLLSEGLTELVDCALCRRTRAFKAAVAARPAKPTVPSFEIGQRVIAYGSAGVIVRSGFDTTEGKVRIRWIGGRDDGRTNDMPVMLGDRQRVLPATEPVQS